MQIKVDKNHQMPKRKEMNLALLQVSLLRLFAKGSYFLYETNDSHASCWLPAPYALLQKYSKA